MSGGGGARLRLMEVESRLGSEHARVPPQQERLAMEGGQGKEASAPAGDLGRVGGGSGLHRAGKY